MFQGKEEAANDEDGSKAEKEEEAGEAGGTSSALGSTFEETKAKPKPRRHLSKVREEGREEGPQLQQRLDTMRKKEKEEEEAAASAAATPVSSRKPASKMDSEVGRGRKRRSLRRRRCSPRRTSPRRSPGRGSLL